MEIKKTETGLADDSLFQPSSDKESQRGKIITGDVHLPWIVEGTHFPHETQFRAKYKGSVYYGTVRNGALALGGKEFFSPCAAAVSITRNPVDGWLFWDCRLPGKSSWINLDAFKT